MAQVDDAIRHGNVDFAIHNLHSTSSLILIQSGAEKNGPSCRLQSVNIIYVNCCLTVVLFL